MPIVFIKHRKGAIPKSWPQSMRDLAHRIARQMVVASNITLSAKTRGIALSKADALTKKLAAMEGKLTNK